MRTSTHGRDLRKGRVSIPGQVYLVTAVTYKRKPFFKEFSIGRIVVEEMVQSERLGSAGTLAFVIMPDHLHWLLSLGSPYSLSRVISGVKSYSANSINKILSSSGQPVWQRGFHDHAIRRDEDVIGAARYIIANPLRAGLVRRVGDYPLWDAVWL
jgi:REP element-mobilizing transposase RayT